MHNCLLHTLNANSRLTRNGKDIACRILFSFRVCSTCFNFTTCFKIPNILTAKLNALLHIKIDTGGLVYLNWKITTHFSDYVI